MTTRPMAVSGRAVVSSSSLPSSLAGRDIIKSGGNVFDALVATSLALAVTQNNLCGLGGDMFAILRKSDGSLDSLNGSGRGFLNLSLDYFESKGLRELPARGLDAAITVPGMVKSLNDIHSKYCTMEQKDLIRPAFELASNGIGVTENYSHSIEASSRIFSGMKGWERIFKPDNRVPQAGSIFKQKDLAATLKSMMEDGLDSYYNGYLADRIIKGLESQGSMISEMDLKSHRSSWEKPLYTDFEGYRFYETGPNSQGATALLWLNLANASALDIAGEEALTTSRLIKLGLIAYNERDHHITDPEYHALPSDFLSADYAEKLLQNEYILEAGNSVKKQGDTTYFCIADTDGNAVSVIQSNYMGFGSGIVPDGTGFVMQNRGSYFSLNPDHHNHFEPGKRTFHTLCASMVEKDHDFSASMGTMGGDIQPQIHLQLFRNFLRSMNPQASLDKPRWAFPYTIYEKPHKLIFEDSTQEPYFKNIPVQLKKELLGFSSQLGHAQIVQTGKDGSVTGGADPRGDGISISV